MTSNSITVVGNLTRDPELRYTQSGKATVTVGIAVNRRYQVNGEWQDATTFMRPKRGKKLRPTATRRRQQRER